MFLLLNQL